MDSKLQRPKIEFISQSPFKNTVYLDSDTLVDQNISDLFLLLEKYDFSAAFVIQESDRIIVSQFPNMENTLFFFRDKYWCDGFQ